MPGHGEKLTRSQETALAALLAEPTITAAAAKVGVAEKTLRLWLSQPAFKTAFAEVRRVVLEVAITRTADACGEAVAALRGALSSARVADQIAAARVILDTAAKGTELLDVVRRVEQIEETMGGKTKAKK